MVNVLEQLKENYIFAVIRGNSAKDAIEISKYSILDNYHISFFS